MDDWNVPSFRQGDHVRVVDGPFLNFVGLVLSVEEGRRKVHLIVRFFGRVLPVELDVLQVTHLEGPIASPP